MTYALGILFLVFALAYTLICRGGQVSWTRSAIKTGAVTILALIAWVEGGTSWLIAALAFSALGDFLLSRPSNGAFLAGMAAFFAAHVGYVFVFLSIGSDPTLLAQRWPALLGLVVFALVLYRVLWSGLAEFRIPVAVYMIAILAMGAAALGLALDRPAGLIVAGAASFIFSDSVLAVEKFSLSEEARARQITPYLVWIFYVTGQALILTGALLA